MRPRTLQLLNFRSHRDLTVDLPDGCLSITGPNGAGKSSILTAIDVALFGPEGRSLAPYLTDGEERMRIQLEFDHAGASYRVVRALDRGKTTVDLAVLRDGTWDTLTAETAKATQERLDALLGLTRRTLRASSLLMQSDGGAFCEADPKERRQILSEALGLDRFARYQALVVADRKTATASQQRLAGVIEALGDPDLLDETAFLAASTARDAQTRADTLAEEIAQDAAAVELLSGLWERMSAEHAHADKARTDLDTARERLERLERDTLAAEEATSEAERLREQARPLQALADSHATYAASLRDLETAATDVERQAADKQRHDQQHARAALRVEALTTERDELAARIESTRSLPDATCDRCHQHLTGTARASALASLDQELVQITETLDATRQEAERAVADSAAITIPDLDELRRLIDEARDIERKAAAAKIEAARILERASLLDTQAASATSPEHLDATAAQRANVDQLAATLASLATHTPLEIADARGRALTAKAALDARSAEHARLVGSLDGLARQAEQATDTARRARESVADHAEAGRRIGDLQQMERAYGPAGIPTLILEHTAIPAIETEANRVLSQLGGQPAGWTVELRTQRDTASGGVSETLDVTVLTGSGERDYRALSGGERTRVAVALRLGVARLLAHRQGADCQLLALDEPDALDAEGKQALVDVLLDRAGEYATVVLISHDPDLRDRFDHVIQVGEHGEAAVNAEPAVGLPA